MTKSKKPDVKTSRPPPQPTDCRDAMHWFVDSYGQYISSSRGLLVTDVSADQEAYIESAIVTLRNKGTEPFVVAGEEIVGQSEVIWQKAMGNSPYGQPYWSMSEIDFITSDIAMITDMVAPEQPHQLWYLFHYILYPRMLNNKPTIITTPLGLDEFLAYGAECDDIEYAGYKITWDKISWLFDACMIDLHHFRQVKSEGLPPMLKAEYHLFNAIKERELSVVSQQILGDYQLDISVTEGDNRLAVELDKLTSLDPPDQTTDQSKKNFVLLSDGWKILRFTANEVLEDLSYCADAVEQVWKQGRKKASVGRLLFGRKQPSLPAVPQDDEVQKLAITSGAGPVAVTGCSGTGKTFCVAHRIEYLLAQGVAPERIIAFTFSEETKLDLERSVEILTDKQTVQKLNISNWKDVGFRILKENASEINRKPPLKLEQNSQRVFERVLKKVKKEYDPVQLELIDQELDEGALRSLIALYKANLVTPKHVQEHGQTDLDQFTAKLYKAYSDQIKKSNKVDDDDCITLCTLFLATNEEARVKYSCKYDYILIDEFQECTAAQNLMARLLSYPQDNLFIAGDEDVALFEAYGAQVRIMAETSIRMPNARCYTLEKNWRSHKAIVKSASSLLNSFAIKSIPKKMEFALESKTRNAIIGPNESKTEKEEVEWVAKEVSILVESGKMAHEIAILWNNQKYATILEAALFKENIRSSASGPSAGSVPDEVGDVMAFLNLVMDPDGPKARKSFERICQLRSRELDQKLTKLSSTIASFGEANTLSFLKAIEIYYEATNDAACKDLNDLVRIVRTMNQESLPPAETINLLKRTQKLRDIYKSAKIPENVVYEPMQKVEQLQEEAREYKTVKEFVKAKELILNPIEGEEEQGFVQIKSIDDAKGKEFPVVFVVGLAEGVFPAEGADAEEERRRFYVAMSRAKELLYLSLPIVFENKIRIPSPFLVEADVISAKAFQKSVAAREQEPPPQQIASEASLEEVKEEPPLTAQEEAVLAKERAQAKAQEQKTKEQMQDVSTEELDSVKANIQAQALEAKEKAEKEAEIAAELRIQQEAQAKADQEAQARANQEAQQKAQQEIQAKAEQEAQLKAQQEAQAKAEQEAQLKAQQEAQARAEQEAQLKAQQEAQAKAEQEAQLKAQQEAQAKAEQEAQLKAQQEAQARAEQEAQLKAQLKAQQEAQAKAEQEAQLKAQQEAQAKAEQEAQLKAQQEAQAKAEQEAQLKARQQASKDRAKQELFPDQAVVPSPPVEEIDSIFGDISQAVSSTNQGSVDSTKEDKPSVEEKSETEKPDKKSKKNASDKLKERAKKKQEEIKARLEAKDREIESDTLAQVEPVSEKTEPVESFEPVQSNPAAQAVPADTGVVSSGVTDQTPNLNKETELVQGESQQAANDVKLKETAQDTKEVSPEPVKQHPEPAKKNPFATEPATKNPFATTSKQGGSSFSISVGSQSKSKPFQTSQNSIARNKPQEEAIDPKSGLVPDPTLMNQPKGKSSGAHSVFSKPVETYSEEPFVQTQHSHAAQPQGTYDQKDAAKIKESSPMASESTESLINDQTQKTSSAVPEDDGLKYNYDFDEGNETEDIPEESTQQVNQYGVPVGEEQVALNSGQPAQVPPQEAPSKQILTVEGTTIPMCPHCMIQLEVGSRFCGECGYQLESRIPACPGCLQPVVPGAKFCGECGFALSHAQ